jgi:hypothetical protein
MFPFLFSATTPLKAASVERIVKQASTPVLFESEPVVAK